MGRAKPHVGGDSGTQVLIMQHKRTKEKNWVIVEKESDFRRKRKSLRVV
jgi:hypothetical protein